MRRLSKIIHLLSSDVHEIYRKSIGTFSANSAVPARTVWRVTLTRWVDILRNAIEITSDALVATISTQCASTYRVQLPFWQRRFPRVFRTDKNTFYKWRELNKSQLEIHVNQPTINQYQSIILQNIFLKIIPLNLISLLIKRFANFSYLALWRY